VRYRLRELSSASNVRETIDADGLAGVTQPEECLPSKQDVAGSNPAARSISPVDLGTALPRTIRRMSGSRFRTREGIALDLVGIGGLAAFLLGLTWLQGSDKLSFDLGEALDGITGQLSITLPAALLVLGASALELAAGLVLARAARREPFDSAAEALLASMVAAVLKDTLLLGTLAAVGWFRAPLLIGLDLAIVAALWAPPLGRVIRPVTQLPGWSLKSTGSWPLAALVLLVWAGPVVLQLASPVVPFIDVLPNYVGPVEHLRTFGWFSPLTATQSPIIGPSRTVLGYDGFLGALATMTNLSGGAGIAAFILPQTVLLAAGAHRLASALRNGDVPVGAWAVLAFALTQPFARLADARGTVVVWPLVCLGLAVAVQVIDQRNADATTTSNQPWRIGRGAVIGLALGAAILVHPVIGFFAVLTVGIVGLARPRDAGPDAFVAGVTAGLVALPQLATMVGLSLPTLALGVGLPAAIVIGVAAGRLVDTGSGIRAGLARGAEVGRIVVLIAAAVALAGLFATGGLLLDRIPIGLGEAGLLALESSGLLLIAIVAGWWLGSSAARSPIVLAGIAVGIAAVVLANVLPADLGFLGDALRFEVPKTVHYWLSSIAAAGAAGALATWWSGSAGFEQRGRRAPRIARAAAVAAFVVVAALPLRFGSSGDDSKCTQDCASINAFHLGEHRWSETFAIDLHFAAIGFWQGFPDSRTVVDAPRRQLLDALRVEIATDRLVHDTPVLHLAKSFQQWSATPLGVFDGVTETFVSLDPEISHQTVGGRLLGLDDLPGFLGSGEFTYLVLEPDGLPDGMRDQVLAAGYQAIFANQQGEVFRLPVPTP
jgi:hypothetical protein